MNQLQERPAQSAAPETTKSNPSDFGKVWKEWNRIHLRRFAHKAHNIVAGKRAVGPVSFLGVAAALGAALTLTTLYSTSYAVTLDGETVGVVADQAIVAAAIREVEQEGSQMLGYDYQVEGDLDYQFGLTLKSDLTDQRSVRTFFYNQLDEVSADLRQYELSVNGKAVGVVQDEEALNEMLGRIMEQYKTTDTTSASFVEAVSVSHVYNVDYTMTIAEIEEILTASSVGETTYVVEKGDTFNNIAHANDMSISDLQALNPEVNINRLSIGQTLNVKEYIPFLSVQTTEHQIYKQAIECPVETVDDPNIYKGDSKIREQGIPGEALVTANVTYVNGYEKERDITESVTLREPTVTVKAVGTKERPKTASYGKYHWPITGRISSYFGGRRIYGSYDFHSGIDIPCAYGASIKAADGGTVTFAGTKGTYGKLVIITHDNGAQTYYAHNSSLLVSAGEKVYRGQPIAKGGSTGRSTGNHCHFEIRINGKSVNPLNYLP